MKSNDRELLELAAKAAGMHYNPTAKNKHGLVCAAEHELKQMLADLHREYQARAEPIVKALASYEALKPPAPFIMQIPQPPASGSSDAGGEVAKLPRLPQSQANGDNTTDYFGRLFKHTDEGMREYGLACFAMGRAATSAPESATSGATSAAKLAVAVHVNRLGATVAVQLKSGEHTRVLYSGDHPAGRETMGVMDLPAGLFALKPE